MVVVGAAAGLLRGSEVKFDARTIVVTHGADGMAGQATYPCVGLLGVVIAGRERTGSVFASWARAS